MAQRRTEPRDAATATRRFGLGPKPGDVARIASDPRGYVLAALADPNAALIASGPELLSSQQAFAAFEEARFERAITRAFLKDAPPQAPQMTEPMPPLMPPPTSAPAPAAAPSTTPTTTPATTPGKAAGPMQGVREAMLAEGAARINRSSATTTPFIERLVSFWSNHFCVSVTKGPVRVMAGAYEREAIRPHVLGRFGDMLKAVVQHPAMLVYLDNAQSIGPTSRAGLNRAKGLNENLAREILELHTVGVDGGYTQADVTQFARVLTGWTFGTGQAVSAQERGRFLFTPNRHEPGTFSVLGKTYGQPGQAAGEAVLADLARQRSTARHIARKLARHFVSDAAPPALVAALEDTFVRTEGDLREVARTLVTAAEAWDHPPAKIVPPLDYTVSLVRGFDLKMPPLEVHRLASVLGQPLWRVPSPQGFPDNDDAWMGPSPIRERLRIAEKIARDLPTAADPRIVLADLGGPGVSEDTRLAVQRAETKQQAFELMIMSVEFMRR